MKNIYILPTDKSSRLVKQKYDTIDRLCLADIATKRAEYKRFNLYITSDEEIKEGDWYITPNNTVLKALGKMLINVEDYKKIILTTDKSLDGVQVIDNEFLEWFVKNPSCEKVFIADDYEQVNQDNPILRGSTNVVHKYKIIIPKEEPKKYPIGGYAPGSYSCKCITCNTMFMGDKRAHQCEPCATKIDDFFKSFPSKQETLEEAAEEYLMKKYQKGTYLGKLFTAGAKWQAQRMFSEEEVRKILWEYIKPQSTSEGILLDSFLEQFKKNNNEQ